jgi:hypothetical protein
MRFTNDPILATVAASGTNTYTSTNPQDTAQIIAGSVQVISTGAVGTAKLQASNDKKNPSNWTDISGATVSVTGTGIFLIPKMDLCYRYIQLVYTNSSGTGNITANFQGIGF